MTADRLWRWTAVIGILAAALTVTSQLLGLAAIDPRDLVGSLRALPAMVFNLTKLAAAILLLLALVGLYACQAVAAGVLGAVAFGTAVVGTALVVGDFWYEGLAVPWLAAAAPEVLTEAATGQVAAFRTVSTGSFVTFAVFALGWVLFGIATARAGVFPRLAGVVVAIGGALGFLGGFPPYQIALALGVGWLSCWLLLRRRVVNPTDRVGDHAGLSAP